MHYDCLSEEVMELFGKLENKKDLERTLFRDLKRVIYLCQCLTNNILMVPCGSSFYHS